MKKIIATALCLMMAGSLMVGCGGEKTTREDAGGGTATAAAAGGESNKVTVDPYSGDPVKIAYVAHDLGTPNNQGWKEGIERECASWDNIKVDSYNAESSAETQVQIMSDVISQKYNAIILQCSPGHHGKPGC